MKITDNYARLTFQEFYLSWDYSSDAEKYVILVQRSKFSCSLERYYDITFHVVCLRKFFMYNTFDTPFITFLYRTVVQKSHFGKTLCVAIFII